MDLGLPGGVAVLAVRVRSGRIVQVCGDRVIPQSEAAAQLEEWPSGALLFEAHPPSLRLGGLGWEGRARRPAHYHQFTVRRRRIRHRRTRRPRRSRRPRPHRSVRRDGRRA